MKKHEMTIQQAKKLTPPFSSDDLKLIRASFSFNQNDFSKLLRVPAPTLKKWEQGQRDIDASTTALYQALLHMREFKCLHHWLGDC